MELHYKLIGLLLMILACIHIIFPKYFNWKDDLKSMSLINRQMMVSHTFFIALTVFLMGLLSFLKSDELIATSLGRTISLGLGIFWAIRLVFQLFIYSSQLWRGKRFETGVHILFTIGWAYIAFVFLYSAISY
jgi:hypothetical protein